MVLELPDVGILEPTDSIEPALFMNNVDRDTLAAMQEAVVASLPDFARFHRAKAELLGHPDGLPWWDPTR